MKSKRCLSVLLAFIMTFSIVLSSPATIVFAAVKKTAFIKITAKSDTTVALKWKKVSNVSGYEIFQKQSGKKYKKIKTITKNKTFSYKVSKLKSATKYTYKIRTYKTVNKKKQYSGFSSVKSVMTKPQTPLLTKAYEKENKVTVSWSKVDRAKGYVIYCKENGKYKQVATVNTQKSSQQIVGNAGDLLKIKAYIIDGKKKIYSSYSKEIKVGKSLDSQTNIPPEADNYVTEEFLQQKVDELKGILENTYVTDEKVQEYLNEFKDICSNSYVTQEMMEEYFEKIKDTLLDGYITEEKLAEYIAQLEISADGYGYVDITKDLEIKNCYYAPWDGQEVSDNNTQSCYFSVTPGEKFMVTGHSRYNVSLAFFFDTEGNLLPDTTYHSQNGKGFYNQTIVIPENCGYVAFASFIERVDPIMLKVKKYQKVSEEKEEIKKSVLYGKTMYAEGDSIAEGEVENTYVDFITKEFAMKTDKKAKCGSTLVSREGYSGSICDRILAMDTTQKYDYILLQGGFNDYFLSIEIGEITKDSDLSGNYDKSTVIGAMETICYHLTENYFESKKLFVLGHKCYGYAKSQVEYWDAIKSVLKKWGIPYVDLREETNLCRRNDPDAKQNTYFVNGDGVHPTEEAYKIFYVPLIKAKLESL